MAKYVADLAMDAALDYIAACTRMDVTSDVGTPANLTNSLADVTLTAGAGNGDYTIGNGDASGRKLTVVQQASVPVDADGTAKHVVLSLTGTIRLATTCTDQVLTTGNTVTIPAFDDEIADPS
jgi:hypothetical protein